MVRLLNRDEEVFRNPYDLDVARRNNDRVIFGTGSSPYLCLGNLPARTEIRILFEELIPRLAGIRLAGEVPRVRSDVVNGIKKLPVEVTLARPRPAPLPVPPAPHPFRAARLPVRRPGTGRPRPTPV